MSSRYKSKRKSRGKSKPRRKVQRKRKALHRCCGRTFKTASAFASHKRGRQHREVHSARTPSRRRRRWVTSKIKEKTPKFPKLPPVRKCAICGDVGDHGGDGHPFERWDDEPKKMVVPRRASAFAIKQVFSPLTRSGEL